jgi:hypothetical protein
MLCYDNNALVHLFFASTTGKGGFLAGKIVNDSPLSPGGMWILFYVAHPDFKITRSA